MKTLIIALQRNPCDVDARKQFWAFLSKMNGTAQEISKATTPLETVIKKPSKPVTNEEIKLRFDALKPLSEMNFANPGALEK